MLEDKWSEVKHLYIPCDALGPSYMHVVFSARCPPTARGQECASAVWYQPAVTTVSKTHVQYARESLSEDKRIAASVLNIAIWH